MIDSLRSRYAKETVNVMGPSWGGLFGFLYLLKNHNKVNANPIKRRFIAAAPLLGAIDISAYLGGIEHVTVGGETGREARECNYDWALDIRDQCVNAGISFWFKSTGSLFKYNGKVQKINPFKQRFVAKEFGINILNGKRLF